MPHFIIRVTTPEHVDGFDTPGQYLQRLLEQELGEGRIVFAETAYSAKPSPGPSTVPSSKLSEDSR